MCNHIFFSFYELNYTDYQVPRWKMFTLYHVPPRFHDQQNITESNTVLVY